MAEANSFYLRFARRPEIAIDFGRRASAVAGRIPSPISLVDLSASFAAAFGLLLVVTVVANPAVVADCFLSARLFAADCLVSGRSPFYLARFSNARSLSP